MSSAWRPAPRGANEPTSSAAHRSRKSGAGGGHSRVPAEHLARPAHARGGGARGAASLLVDWQLAADQNYLPAGGRGGARVGPSGLRWHAELAPIYRRHLAADGWRWHHQRGSDL